MMYFYCLLIRRKCCRTDKLVEANVSRQQNLINLGIIIQPHGSGGNLETFDLRAQRNDHENAIALPTIIKLRHQIIPLPRWARHNSSQKRQRRATEGHRDTPKHCATSLFRNRKFCDPRATRGDFARSAADLSAANKLGDDAYSMIWHFLARGRSGADGAIELSGNVERLESKAWPYAV